MMVACSEDSYDLLSQTSLLTFHALVGSSQN